MADPQVGQLNAPPPTPKMQTSKPQATRVLTALQQQRRAARVKLGISDIRKATSQQVKLARQKNLLPTSPGPNPAPGFPTAAKSSPSGYRVATAPKLSGSVSANPSAPIKQFGSSK